MAYFAAGEERAFGDLGCGPNCGCGPCRSGVSGLSEWYVKDETQEAPEPPPPTPPPAPRRPSQANGAKLGYFGQAVGPESAFERDRRQVQDAISRGIRDPRQLTNIVFFGRHPTLQSNPAWVSDPNLVSHWQKILNRLVLPTLQLSAPGSAPNTPRPGQFRRRRGATSRRPGLGEPPAGPLCDAARSDLTSLEFDLKILNNEVAKGTGASPTRLALKRRLLTVDVNGMIAALDSYIASGCCEPALKTLESEVQALPWPTSSTATRTRLQNAIVAAQGRARKDQKHC
jgi:hypothetical protein